MHTYTAIASDLHALADLKKARLLSRFFKTGKGEYGEGDVFLGIMVPQQREVMKKHYKTAGMEDLELLLSSEIHEFRLVALLILVEKYKKEKSEEEKERLRNYEARFHPQGPPDLTGKAVLLVDDGLATGATTEAAVLSARKQHPRVITVAAPVASTHAVQRLSRVADEVRVLCVDPDFDAVGRYYDVFSQTTDEEVVEVMGMKRET